jgi:hypothetical protein
MTNKQNRSAKPYSRRIPRREFLKLAAATGLLAGCRPAQQPTIPPTPSETAEPTQASTATPPPAKLSKVVRTHHAGVWDGDILTPQAIRQMLDASITELTGLNDATAAWASLFDPSERIGIKINSNQASSWTHVSLVMAVTEQLQALGVPPEQIVIFDRSTDELYDAGFPINEDGPGVRCYGSDGAYTEDCMLESASGLRLSDVLLHCDALINIPILKQHMFAGVSFAMKNHYGNLNVPSILHYGKALKRGLAEVNALPPIRDRTRLIIGDLLEVVLGDHWDTAVTGDSIFMSFDPVAHDTVGLRVLSETMTANGKDPTGYVDKANNWLTNGASLGLGAADPERIEVTEVNLG